MTDTPTLPGSDKRDALRARIEAAERRNAERSLTDDARAAASAAVDYTRAHPLTVIGGALALGLALGLLTRPGRRAAQRVVGSASDAASQARASVKGVTTRGGSRIGTLIGEAALGYIMTMLDEAMDAARTGQERAEELGDAAGDNARALSRRAASASEEAAATSRDLARSASVAARRVVADLARKTKG